MNEIKFYRASGEYGFLSNLFPCKIDCYNKTFRSSEELYQYGKPKNKEIAEWIISAPKQHLVAMAAHGLFGFDIVENWNEIKVDRMKECLKIKFLQHPELEEKLLATGNLILIEDSKTDALWGIGKKSNGKNMLGVLLMELREELKNSK